MAEQNPLERDVRFHAYLGGDRTKPENKRTYDATIVFANTEDAVKCGAKFVVWTLQRLARDGDFPSDRKVRVNSDGSFEKTPEEILGTLPEGQLQALYALMEKRMQAAVEAQMKAYKPAENEDLTEEELEELTAPAPKPVTKQASKKANNRR